ncbi:NAD-dependent epimerase/dehydratase family protein [Photobacterium gaetbulicola]|nr:NAD-dependent epimerase/dehydratase family protein [Photobacterium gaetbulicola]
MLVTGANGFIGKQLVAALEHDYRVTASVRDNVEAGSNTFSKTTEIVSTGNISDKTYWDKALAGVDTVIHLAARAHVLADTAVSPLEAFMETNCKATLRLFRDAVEHGVSRFVFVSSIGVNGNVTQGAPFTEQLQPNPVSDYAISKYEAEQQLVSAAKESAIELVIVRPALVYGKNAPGNIARLAKLTSALPLLPFGLVDNRKSFISLKNLVSLLVLCVSHPAAANQVFLAADTETISTKQLIDTLANVAGRKVIQVPVPVGLMRSVARLLGKGALASQLLDDLVVDNTKARERLGWKPEEDLQSTLE